VLKQFLLAHYAIGVFQEIRNQVEDSSLDRNYLASSPNLEEAAVNLEFTKALYLAHGS